MTREEISWVKYLISWGKYCKRKYLEVGESRKHIYLEALKDTHEMLKKRNFYHGEEKEYEIDSLFT